MMSAVDENLLYGPCTRSAQEYICVARREGGDIRGKCFFGQDDEQRQVDHGQDCDGPKEPAPVSGEKEKVSYHTSQHRTSLRSSISGGK